jgi:uncharacterized membrane protein YciS (DUF1049 family)
MNWVRKLISVAIVLCGAGLGVWFYLDNLAPVTVNLFGNQIEGVQLALWLLIFFAAGTVLGLSVSGVQALRHQMHIQVMRKQFKAMKQKSSVRTSV